MQVALAADEGYFPGLACTIFSIALASRGTAGIDFHVMDGGIADASWNLLESRLAALDPGIRLRRHAIAQASFHDLPPAACGGAMTYARLLMESIIDAEAVIYVDSDFLCFRNLRELWEAPMGSNLIAACQDRGVKRLKEDPVFDLSPEEGQLPYFNAGFMKANLAQWRREGIQARTLALLRENGARCLWWDQTALNVICRGRVHYLDPAYNQYYLPPVTALDLAEGRINLHYAAKTKPWQTTDRKILNNVLWRIACAAFLAGNSAARPSAITNLLTSFSVAAIGAVLAFLRLLSWDQSRQAGRLQRFTNRLQVIQWARNRFVP